MGTCLRALASGMNTNYGHERIASYAGRQFWTWAQEYQSNLMPTAVSTIQTTQPWPSNQKQLAIIVWYHTLGTTASWFWTGFSVMPGTGTGVYISFCLGKQENTLARKPTCNHPSLFLLSLSLCVCACVRVYVWVVVLITWCRISYPSYFASCGFQISKYVLGIRTGIPWHFKADRNGRHFADDIFKCIFLNGNFEF